MPTSPAVAPPRSLVILRYFLLALAMLAVIGCKQDSTVPKTLTSSLAEYEHSLSMRAFGAGIGYYLFAISSSIAGAMAALSAKWSFAQRKKWGSDLTALLAALAALLTVLSTTLNFGSIRSDDRRYHSAVVTLQLELVTRPEDADSIRKQLRKVMEADFGSGVLEAVDSDPTTRPASQH